MNFTPEKLKTARDSGYSDDEIWNFLGKDDQRFNLAKENGYTLDDTINTFSKVSPPEPERREGGGIVGGAADIGIQFMKGLGTGTRMISDVFGANNPVSKSIAGYEDYFDSLLSAESKQDSQEISRILKEAEGKGILPQIMAGLEAFTVAPAEMTASTMGMMLPNLAGGVYSKAAQLTKAGVIGLQMGIGAAQGAGSIKGQIYTAVQEELRQQGLPEDKIDDIATEAQAYNGKNLDQILIGAGLGAAASSTGAEKIMTRLITGAGKEASEDIIKAVIKGGFSEAPIEGLQGGQEKIAENVALQRIGVDVPTMQGVIPAATMEATAGLVIGGGFGGVEALTSLEQNEEKKIDKQSNQVANELLAENTPATQSVVKELARRENAVTNLQEAYDALEPTSQEAQKLKLELSEAQRNLSAFKEVANKAGLSETITEAEKQQIELAKAITEPAPEVVAPVSEVAPEVPAPVTEAITPPAEVAPTAPVAEVAPAPTEVTPTIAETLPAAPEAPAITPAKIDILSTLEAIRDGKLVKAYHGSKNINLTETKSGSSFTTSKVLADKFAGKSGTTYEGEIFIPKDSPVYENAVDLLERIKNKEISPEEAQRQWEMRPNEIRPKEIVAVSATSKATPTPAVSETITPAEPEGISVGNRIKLGKSPQTYIVEEAIPQTEAEKANNKQYYSVKNERTGETQVVEKADMKQVGGKRVRKIAAGKRNIEDQIAYKIAADYLDFAEEEASKNRMPSKITGNENKLVKDWKLELSQIVINKNTGEPDTSHPYYEQWKSLQTKAGIERVAANIKNIAVSLIKFNPEKYSNFIKIMRGEPAEIRRMANELESFSEFKNEEIVTPIPEANRYTFEEAVKAVDAHFGKQGIPEGVVIVNNTTEPDLEMKAGYFVNRGQIVINLAYIAKGENLGDIIDHELGHYIFGDPKFQADFKKFWELMTPEEKAKADQIINQFYNKETGAVQMEEKQVRAFMQLIQDSKAMPKWKQLLDKIKRWINEKLGTNLQVTDRGALAVLAAAHKRFKSGEQIVREIDSGVLKTKETAQDAEYLAAVERGDMETAQRMVDEAAKKAGYGINQYSKADFETWAKTIGELDQVERIAINNSISAEQAIANANISPAMRKVAQNSLERNRKKIQEIQDRKQKGLPPKRIVRGDNRADITVYRGVSGRSIWATDSEQVAQTYGSNVRGFFFEMQNPLVVDAEGSSFRELSFEGSRLDADDLSDIAKERGYDGLIIRNFYDSNTDDGGEIIADHFTVFNPSQIKSADPVTYDDAGNVIPLSQRFQPSEPDIRRMAVEPTGEKPTAKRKSIMGEELGELKDTPKNIIAKTKKLLRERVLNPSEVTEKNTTEAFRALGKLLGNKQERRDFADELNNIATIVDDTGAAAEVSMGAALFVNDLFEYAVRLAAQGDKKMLGIMMSKINDLPTGTEGRSDAGRALRAAREMKDTFLTMAKAEQDAFINYAAEFVYGPNPTKQQVDSIKIGYDAVEKVQEPTAKEVEEEIAAVGEKTGTDLVGRINDEFTKATEKGQAKRKTEIEELDSEYKKIQEQADKEIEKLAKIQSDTPSFDPTAARQTANDIRAIVANDLKQRPDMGRKAPWKSMLVAKLQEAGVEVAAAETLADIVWRQHEINNLSRELSSINKAVEKGPISEIIKAIKETPLEQQQNPNWRYEVMRDYLRKAGLSVAQAERIAKLMDISLQKRFTQAKEQAFTDAISKTAPWKAGDVRSKRAFQQVIQAIRAGALDPSRNMASDIAAMNGWTGFTADQYKNLFKNDAILANEDSKDIQKAEAYKAIQDIISKSKLPIRARDVIGQYYDAQALSGIPTLTVNSFSPIAFAMRNAIVQAGSGTIKGDAKAIGRAATAFVDSIKSWANTVAFSFKNNVTVYSNVDYIVNDDNLLRLYRKGVDQFTKSKNAKERADGVKNMMIGMMDYVRRILNALDYGAIASLQNQNISKYAMAVMKRQKMNDKQANEMFGVMMKAKNDFYLQQIAIGTDKNKAGILADEFYISSWKEALSKAGVEKSDIQQAMDAAINDALSSVGRNRQSLDAFKEEDTKLKDAGVSSMPALWLLESVANAANRSDNQVVKLFSRVIYGFAIVPARVIRETAWFSPYGFVRFGYDWTAKKMGKTSPYAQSLGTDVQYSQRLAEATAGTVALLGLMALRSGSTDDPEDEDEFKIVFTGNGPQRKDDAQFYDSWYKAGNKPNSMIVSFGKTKFTLNMMRGFEAFTWPAMMLGAIDDLEIRKKQKQQTKTPAQLEDAAIVAGFVFDAALRRGPYAFTTKSLFGTYGDIGVEGVAKGLTFPAKTLIPVLGTSLASNLSNFLNDPIDRRTLDGAVWSNIPFIGPAVAPKSLNAFGEPSLSTDLASKMFKLGVPIVYDIPTDRESIKLHELVLKQGGGPSIPTRNQLAQRLDRQPTNKEYEMFVREYGTILTKSMKKNYDKLFNAKPEFYSRAIERIGNRARDVAENKVRQAAKKP